MYKIRVNKDDNKIFDIFDFDVIIFEDDPIVKIKSDNFAEVKEAFGQINTIEFFNNQMLIAEYTIYDSFSDISYNGKIFSNEDDALIDCLCVRLTKTNLAEQIRRINEKINPVINEGSLTIDELKELRIEQISKLGEADIFAGDNVTFDDGTTKAYTFEIEDQNNLQTYLSLISQIPDKSKIAIPYHAVGEICQNYSAKQIVQIYFTLQTKLLSVYTYVNMLRLYINSLTDINDVKEVSYGAELPQEYAEQMSALINQSVATIMEIKKQYNFDSEELTSD